MKTPSRYSIFPAAIFLTFLMILFGRLPALQAQEGSTAQTAAAEEVEAPPFRLPFTDPPGPDTWLLAQPYGNTVGAYFQRFTTYGASGGIHFGVDLAAPCGTEVVAIADGVVFAVDGPFGSPPHNLMIDHLELGYASMYGHLLEVPPLSPGQVVKQGQVIAKVGDSRGDCNLSPHLHLEIRDLKHFQKFNPMALIEADWNQLALVGGWSRGFMQDLDEPRKWQTLYDQPEAQTGGPIVNNFARTWPLDWEKNGDNGSTQRWNPTPTPTAEAMDDASAPAQAELVFDPPSNMRQITQGDCCTNFYFNDESSEIRFIDRPVGSESVGVWGVDITQPNASPKLVTERLGIYNADNTLVAYPHPTRLRVVVARLDDGEQWEIDTNGNGVSFTPDGRLLWTDYDSEVSWRSRRARIWLADIDGSNAEMLATIERGGPVAWLSDTELLVSRRVPPSQDVVLSILSLEDGSLEELAQLPRTRGGLFSPDKQYLAYQVRNQTDSDENGLWLLDLQSSDLEPESLPFFGAFRWPDEQHLVYIPFDPDASGLIFYEYNVVTGQSRPLFPKDGKTLKLNIANNEWRVSPDGRKIALLAANDKSLNGIWVIELGGR